MNLLELDDQYYAVELQRGLRGFGFSIRGGREFHSMPLFVLRIAADGAAAADGRLRVGDQIIEINGINTKNMTHGEAIDLIKSGQGMVRLLVRRGKMPPFRLNGCVPNRHGTGLIKVGCGCERAFFILFCPPRVLPGCRSQY